MSWGEGSATSQDAAQRVNPSVLGDFCSLRTFHTMLQAYLDLVYPLIPICHIPTLLSDVHSGRGDQDPVFCILLISMCTLVVSIVPQRLPQFAALEQSPAFASSRSLVSHAHTLTEALKPCGYHDQYSLEKWSIAYLWAAIFGYSSVSRRADIYFAEAQTIFAGLQLHRSRSLAHLDAPHAQVAKKAFWLMHTGYTYVSSNRSQDR